MVPGFGAALGLLLLGATEVGAGVDATAQAGFAPIGPTEPSEPALAGILVPKAAMTTYGRRRALTLTYAPRLYIRHPNLAGSARPLLLHRGSFDYGDALTRRLRFTTELAASAGEVDYSHQALVFTETQTTPAQSAVIEMATVSAVSAVAVQSTRRLQLSLGAQAAHSRPLDATLDIATTSRVLGTAAQRYQLTRVDTLGTSLAAGQVWFDKGPRYWVVDLLGSWLHRLEREAALDLAVGASAARLIGGDERFLLSPAGRVNLFGPLSRGRRSALSGRLTLTLGAGFDPVLLEYVPAAGAGAGLYWQRGPHWQAGLEVDGRTAVTKAPNATTSQQTYLSAHTFVREQLRPSLVFEYGLMAQSRASHLAAEHFELFNREAWAYVRVSWGLRTRSGMTTP